MTEGCRIEWLGRTEYQEALKLQKQLTRQRAAGQIPDTLLLLEHPPTYTIGIDGHREQLLLNRETLAQLDVACYRVDRGGGISYHGPGQLVVYPILDLRNYGCNYHGYIDLLARAIIQTLAFFKVRAFRERGQPWMLTFCDDLQASTSRWSHPDACAAIIASIGVKVDEHLVTSHGFCVNVNPALDYFDPIIPSNLHGCTVTTLEQVLNKPTEIRSVLEPVIKSFCQVFGVKPVVANSARSVLSAGDLLSLTFKKDLRREKYN